MKQLPNILFITADQLRKDALGCYGNAAIQTPTIDRLAEQGVRFDQTFAAYPNTGALLPAMGYGDEQIKDLEDTINATPCDLVIIGTPIDGTPRSTGFVPTAGGFPWTNSL